MSAPPLSLTWREVPKGRLSSSEREAREAKAGPVIRLRVAREANGRIYIRLMAGEVLGSWVRKYKTLDTLEEAQHEAEETAKLALVRAASAFGAVIRRAT